MKCTNEKDVFRSIEWESVLCYAGKPSGYDRVRNAEIGNKVCIQYSVDIFLKIRLGKT